MDGVRNAGIRPGELLAVTLSRGIGVGLAAGGESWSVPSSDPVAVVAEMESTLRPRWVWWSAATADLLVRNGPAPARCWDLAAVHRLLHGGWRADAQRVWAGVRGLDGADAPVLGQLDLLATSGDDGGDPEDPVGPDGYLRPEWTGGGWARTPARLQRWSAVALDVAVRQQHALGQLSGDAAATARSESAAELLCAELAHTGLPIDRARAEQIITTLIGARPLDPEQQTAQRGRRDDRVLRLVPDADRVDLRNPAQVRALLLRVGIDVPDTRSWRLEPMIGLHPVVEALVLWRKAERVATTYGYSWLDRHVSEGRLRGAWSGSDGAAGRMTAQAGLHNLPAELRPAVVADADHVFVRADLGQIEPRILAAVSGDPAFTQAAREDDLYAPVAERLGVLRPVAKVAVLAAMYGQTSGAAGEALRGMDAAYPVAMRFLRTAEQAGRSGRAVRTYGGRLIPVGPPPDDADRARSQGRFVRNAVVQGAAAEFFKAWAVTVRARAAPWDAQIVLCLHDELLVHTPAQHADAVVTVLRDCLAETAHRWAPRSGVRFVADIAAIRRWSDAKD